ncbi:hypothetical protein MRX96_043488 [Rhipicephalus microplus]
MSLRRYGAYRGHSKLNRIAWPASSQAAVICKPQSERAPENHDAAALSIWPIESADLLPPSPNFFRRRRTRSGFAMLAHFLSREEEGEEFGRAGTRPWRTARSGDVDVDDENAGRGRERRARRLNTKSDQDVPCIRLR